MTSYGCYAFTLNIGFPLFHISGFRFGWYAVFVSVYCTNSETTCLFIAVYNYKELCFFLEVMQLFFRVA